jgi:hypothetical protein
LPKVRSNAPARNNRCPYAFIALLLLPRVLPTRIRLNLICSTQRRYRSGYSPYRTDKIAIVEGRALTCYHAALVAATGMDLHALGAAPCCSLVVACSSPLMLLLPFSVLLVSGTGISWEDPQKLTRRSFNELNAMLEDSSGAARDACPFSLYLLVVTVVVN